MSGAPMRVAETAKPLMKVSAKPARSTSWAESASKQQGITWRPGSASTARRRSAGPGFAAGAMVR